MRRLIHVLETFVTAGTFLMAVFRIVSPIHLRGFQCQDDGAVGFIPCASESAWLEIGILIILVLLAFLSLIYAGRFHRFMQLWRSYLFLIAFLFFALLSGLWSVFPEASLYRGTGVLLISLLASYIGTRWDLPINSRSLAVLFGVIAVASLAFALALPGWGTMTNPPYDGAWKGIFWHRNYLGTLMAIGSAVFLIRVFQAIELRKPISIDLLFYLLTLVLVFQSRSATGIILAVVLSALGCLVLIWVRYHQQFTKRVYAWIGGSIGMVILLLAVNLDRVLGLLGRNASLTGRIPLWQYLLTEYVSRRPLNGYGMGAFFSFETIQNHLQIAMDWGYPIVIGDNGWMDILLGLGWIGVILFTAVLIVFGYRSIKHFLTRRTIAAALPILVFVGAIIGNISLSLFLEVEMLVWVILVILAFTTTPFVDAKALE